MRRKKSVVAHKKSRRLRWHTPFLLLAVVFGFALFTFFLASASSPRGVSESTEFDFSGMFSGPPPALQNILGFNLVTPYNIQAKKTGSEFFYSLTFYTRHLKENYDLLHTGVGDNGGFVLKENSYSDGNFYMGFSRSHELLTIYSAKDGGENSGEITVELHKSLE